MSGSRKEVLAEALEAEVGGEPVDWGPCSPMTSSAGRRTPRCQA